MASFGRLVVAHAAEHAGQLHVVLGKNAANVPRFGDLSQRLPGRTRCSLVAPTVPRASGRAPGTVGPTTPGSPPSRTCRNSSRGNGGRASDCTSSALRRLASARCGSLSRRLVFSLKRMLTEETAYSGIFGCSATSCSERANAFSSIAGDRCAGVLSRRFRPPRPFVAEHGIRLAQVVTVVGDVGVLFHQDSRESAWPCTESCPALNRGAAGRHRRRLAIAAGQQMAIAGHRGMVGDESFQQLDGLLPIAARPLGGCRRKEAEGKAARQRSGSGGARAGRRARPRARGNRRPPAAARAPVPRPIAPRPLAPAPGETVRAARGADRGDRRQNRAGRRAARGDRPAGRRRPRRSADSLAEKVVGACQFVLAVGRGATMPRRPLGASPGRPVGLRPASASFIASYTLPSSLWMPAISVRRSVSCRGDSASRAYKSIARK